MTPFAHAPQHAPTTHHDLESVVRGIGARTTARTSIDQQQGKIMVRVGAWMVRPAECVAPKVPPSLPLRGRRGGLARNGGKIKCNWREAPCPAT